MRGPLHWLQFYLKGREAGFSFREIGVLRLMAIQQKLEHPAALFWSRDQLDRSLRRLISQASMRVSEMEPQFAQLLSMLLGLRQRMDLDQPRPGGGLRSSRRLSPRQLLRISLPGGGAYSSIVLEIHGGYLALSYPVGPKLPDGFSWKNRRIRISFSRAYDGSYSFETDVMADYSDRSRPILHVRHNDSLQREQRRCSVRVETSIPASLYPLKTVNEVDTAVEKARGVRSRIVDLSEGGCAVLVGGKARVGIPLKLQFSLGEDTLVTCGVVRSVSSQPAKGTSVLHVQNLALPVEPKVRILTYVYNYLNERSSETARPSAAAIARAASAQGAAQGE